MNDLSKHQMILVALLVSFVTSLTTGIVTVSLMDQAPSGVTRTITQVIQQTVAGAVAPGASSTAAVAIAVSDQVAEATEAVLPSIVRLRDGDTGPVVGLGLVVSDSGAIMSDKTLLDKLNTPQAIFFDGTIVSVAVSRFQIQGDVAFLSPTSPFYKKIKPITFADSARLGASVWSLFGTSTYTLSQGIVSELDPIASSQYSVIHTTIQGTKVLPGAPLFDATGAVAGIETGSFTDSTTAVFYPVQAAKNGVPM